MKTDHQHHLDHEVRTIAPSPSFIKSIAELLGTDPSDLLAEMGHYNLSSEESDSRLESLTGATALV
jgi:hypothetical protein